MARRTASSLSSKNLRELDFALRKIWSYGANVIVGWRALPLGIQLIHLHSYALPAAAKRHPDLLDPQRCVTSKDRYESLLAAGCKVSDTALSFALPDSGPAAEHIDDLLRYYTVTVCDCRAVALFDMVNFSLYSTFEQITLINILSHYINSAALQCQRHGMPIELSMSTTGDGFYVWNRKEGLAADLTLYALTMLALVYNNTARRRARTASVPQLRCGIHFGSHFEYYQAHGDPPDVHGFIVGDVTISLARMMSAAQANQTIIGSYVRELGEDDSEWRETIDSSAMDTPSFVALAQSRLNDLVGVPVPGGKIATIKAYLTGDRLSEDEFSIKRYRVVDKHGIEHKCFNAKLTVTDTSGGGDVYVGLMDKDLGVFDRLHVAAEDIRVRLV